MTPDNALKDLHGNCSPALKRIIFNGMEEVIGCSGVNMVLNRAGLGDTASPDACSHQEKLKLMTELSRVQDKLEDLYGVSGGRGLALRTGRACFSMGLQQFGKSLGLLELDYRLLPPLKKVHFGLQKISHFLNEESESIFKVEGNAGQFRWIVQDCPVCKQHHTEVPMCHLLIGLLQEFSYWASGGKNYNIIETECSAMGAEACVISIDKQPIE